MTIHKILKSLSAEDLALTKRYYEVYSPLKSSPAIPMNLMRNSLPKTGSASLLRSH